nr:OprD family outer membrane porin [Pseudomonas frederiksbergensis]
MDSNSKGEGSYNLQVKDAHHRDRDVALRYSIPNGGAKGLSVASRWTAHRTDDEPKLLALLRF